MNEIIKSFKGFNNSIIEKQVFDEIMKTNEFSEEFSLKLSENDIKEIIKTRNTALKISGRIEFNGQIITKIIKKFCDSSYISQCNYMDTINELVEIFYDYKNETLDLIGDDELIEIMKKYFEGYCQGSLELLEGKVMYVITENVRKGMKNYADIDNEKDY